MVVVSPGVQFARWSAIGLGAVVGLFSGRRTHSDKIIERQDEQTQIISEHPNQPINKAEAIDRMPSDEASEVEWTKYIQKHL